MSDRKIANPGTAVAKVWQGQVELILRVVVILCNIATLVTSILTLTHVQDNLLSSIPPLSDIHFETIFGLSYNKLVRNSTSAAVVGITLVCFGLLYEIVLIILRFVNIGLINVKIKVFLGIDVIISFILSAVFGLVGILAAYTASQWADLATKLGDTPLLRISMPRDLLTALAATSLIGALFVALLMIWLVLFLLKNWNKRIVDKNADSSEL